MKTSTTVAVVLSVLALAGCKKKADAPATAAVDVAPQSPAATLAPAASATAPADSTDAQRELAKKQSLLAYGTMEDTYINDPAGQWATTATASSTFGDDGGRVPSPSSVPKNVEGAPDNSTWTNNRQDMGFDWLLTTYAKPVSATEVRVVFRGDGSEAVSKVELQGSDGKWTTVWTGISDVKRDARGDRTWFVRSFPKTTTPVTAVKVTLANAVQRGYKVVDSVQLVGS